MQVHLLTFDEEFFEISTTIFSHPHEIWDISASKEDPDLFFTCYREGNVSSSPRRRHKSLGAITLRTQKLVLLIERCFFVLVQMAAYNTLVIDGKRTQSKASLWRMKREYQEQEEEGHEGMHHHHPRGELEHILSLDIGDGSVKK